MIQKIIEIQEFQVSGIKTRTTNQDEMNPETAKISILWQRLESDQIIEKIQNQKEEQILYGVYSDFADEDRGEYDLLIGKKTELAADSKQSNELTSMKIQSENIWFLPVKEKCLRSSWTPGEASGTILVKTLN